MLLCELGNGEGGCRSAQPCPRSGALRQWRREDRAGIDGGHLGNSKTVRDAIASRRYSELRCAGPPQLSALSHVRDIALFRPEPGMKYSLLLLIGCLLSIPAQAADPAVQKLQARIAADPYPEYLVTSLVNRSEEHTSELPSLMR